MVHILHPCPVCDGPSVGGFVCEACKERLLPLVSTMMSQKIAAALWEEM